VKINLSQIGVKKFKSTIHSRVVVSCKLFIFLFFCYRDGIDWTCKRSRQRGFEFEDEFSPTWKNDAYQFTSRPVLIKWIYLVILTLDEGNLGGVGKLI
jgi:hypothetical protein